MANFLGNFGAAIQGQQNYQTWLTQQEDAKLRIEAQKQNLAQIQDLTDSRNAQKTRDQGVAQTVLDYLSQGGGQGIPPPPPAPATNASQPPPGPQGGPPPQQPGQPPAPGQQSVRMMQPGQGMPPQGQRPPQGPPQGPPPQMPPGQMGPPPIQQQRPQQPPMPPYQTVGGAPQQQQPPQGISAPPPQVPQAPPPNSMTLQDAAKFIKSRGITDPVQSLQVLEKLTPYLDNQAKQEAQMLKMQLDQQNKVQALQEKAREEDQRSEDRKLSVDERKAAAEASNQTRQMLGTLTASIAQQNANTRSQSLQQKIATGNALSKDDVDFMADQYWSGDKSVLTGLGRTPAALAAVRSAITQKGKAMGKTGSDLATATAEFEGLKAGERTLGTRTANVGMAGNEAATFARNALEASSKVDRTKYPDLNKVLLAAQQKTGDPSVIAFGSYNNSLINAYARAINPNGAPTVSDKDHAREILQTNFNKGQYEAGVNVILKEIEGAKASPGQTKQELRDLANGGGAGRSAAGPIVLSDAAQLKAAIASGKLKKGDTFNDPSGNPHVVN